MSSTRAAIERPRCLAPARDRTQPFRAHEFFPATAAAMVAAVLLGFAPTFYLRAFGVEHPPPGLEGPLPGHLLLHGLALSAWFLVYLAQTLLIARGRRPLHRLLGGAGGVAAVGVVLTTLVTLHFGITAPHRVPLGRNTVVLVVDLLGIAQFALLAGAALALRRQAQWHSRLMYLANVPLLAAALVRLPGAALLPLGVQGNLAAPFLLALVARDLITARRLHPATLWGGLVFLVATKLLLVPLGAGSFGRWVAGRLG